MDTDATMTQPNRNSKPTAGRPKEAEQGFNYLDMQAYVGITKHNGGFAATDELLSLCHVENAREVLYVGSGIGVGPCYIAKKHGCRVVGIDISEKMIEWSHRRASEERVQDRVEFRTADVLALPFEADRFDAVLVESVIAFVDDRSRAISECVRVAKPGGYVGINETSMTRELSPELVAQIQREIGVAVPQAEVWQSLWDKSGLQDRRVKIYPIEIRSEIRDRIRWVGWRWALKGFARLFRLYLTNPGARAELRGQFGSASTDAMTAMQYGLYIGRKPSA